MKSKIVIEYDSDERIALVQIFSFEGTARLPQLWKDAEVSLERHLVERLEGDIVCHDFKGSAEIKLTGVMQQPSELEAQVKAGKVSVNYARDRAHLINNPAAVDSDGNLTANTGGGGYDDEDQTKRKKDLSPFEIAVIDTVRMAYKRGIHLT